MDAFLFTKTSRSAFLAACNVVCVCEPMGDDHNPLGANRTARELGPVTRMPVIFPACGLCTAVLRCYRVLSSQGPSVF